eukprot:1408824-Rhodomonas_salina.1
MPGTHIAYPPTPSVCPPTATIRDARYSRSRVHLCDARYSHSFSVGSRYLVLGHYRRQNL